MSSPARGKISLGKSEPLAAARPSAARHPRPSPVASAKGSDGADRQGTRKSPAGIAGGAAKGLQRGQAQLRVNCPRISPSGLSAV
jgi:hypothetical protein